MSATTPRAILEYGLASGNVGLVQLLGLCPLLAVSNNAVNALGLGLATVLALVLTNTAIAGIRKLTRHDVRIPTFVMVIAAVVTSIELAIRAWLPELHGVLGIFIPLIVTNCALMGRAEAFASRNTPARAALDGLATGLGFALALVALGGVREILGQGTLFAQAHMLFGQWGAGMTLTLIPEYRGLLLAMLPPGAFILLGLLIAARNAIDSAAKQRIKARAPNELPSGEAAQA